VAYSATPCDRRTRHLVKSSGLRSMSLMARRCPFP
jgi:hypothetical protein